MSKTRRTILIGDVHGCKEEFYALLHKVKVTDDDRVICLGDLMDKGPDPVGCVRIARMMGAQALLGNHEEKHLRWRKYEERRVQDPHYKNPMRPLPEKYAQQNADLNSDDIAYLRNMSLISVLNPTWVAVHAGLLPKLSLNEQPANAVIRIHWVDAVGGHVPIDYEVDFDKRVKPDNAFFWTEVYDGPYNVVYGHATQSLSSPRIDHRPQGVTCYGIDTGCVYGGHLTALILNNANDVEIVQVKAYKAYATPVAPIPG